MGNSKAEKVESLERIVGVAAEAFRELGVDGISVADPMHHAGRTCGGFYPYFSSSDKEWRTTAAAALATLVRVRSEARAVNEKKLSLETLQAAARELRARLRRLAAWSAS